MKQLELFEPASILESKEFHTLRIYYPFMTAKIEILHNVWHGKGEDIVELYLNGILLQTRNGTRRGFPPEHAACILNLIELRKKLQNDEFKET